MNISADASATAVNLGTGLDAKTVTVGSTSGASVTTLQSGSGAMKFTAGGVFDVNATGAVTIDTINDTNGIKIGTVQIGVPISIGHTTSEVTVNHNLNVTGKLITSSGTVTSSDKRLKENISTVVNSLDILQQIRPVHYSLIKDEESKMCIGVLAQELQSVLPQLVHTNASTGFLAVDYTSMIALLISGMQDQQKTINELKKDIVDIKNKL